MSTLLQRLISITDHIEKLSHPLKKLGVCWFTHDITFGKGEISILTNRPDILNFYYKYAFPVVCTTDEGRALAAGIYLTQNLISHQDYSQIHPILSQKFIFNYGIHIVERDVDRQHVYSFAYNLTENDFLHVAINNIGRLQAFIEDYKVKANAVITQATKQKNRLHLPYGELLNSHIATSLDLAQEIQTQPLNFDTVFNLTNTQLDNLLTKRHYAIQLDFRRINLSKMEICTLIQLLKGLHAGQIAQALEIKQTTAESYLANIKNKLSVNKKSELIHLMTNKKILQQVTI